MIKPTSKLMLSLCDTLKELADSLRLRPFFQGLWTPLAGLSFAFGAIGLFFAPAIAPSITRLILGALAEELTYRALVQAQFEQSLRGKLSLGKLSFGLIPLDISYACIIISCVFAGLHAITQSLLMSALIFFPSLVFGVLWTRFRSTLLCALMHFWYNFAFFYI